jgi:transcription antitermination factor NusG
MIAEQNLGAQLFSTFRPLAIERTPVKGRFEDRRIEPFGGYIFVRFDVDVDRWEAIASTRGVRGLLPVGRERPSAIMVGFVEAMIVRMSSGGLRVGDEFDLAVKVGAIVSIGSGAFAGFDGKVINIQHGRVELLMQLFGRDTQVKVPFHQLEYVRRLAA